jgi:hypothetical protein
MLSNGSIERLVRAPEMETGAAETDAAAPTSESAAVGVAPAAQPAPLQRNADAGERTSSPEPFPETSFPETWRHDMAAGDKAFLKTLDRFESPAALAKAYKELTTKLSAGELRAARPPAAGTTPEQVAAWRTAHGLPESTEAYVSGLTLGDGMLAGEANRPLLLSFAEAALAGNWSGEQYSQAVRWYFATQDRLLAERQRGDGEFKHAAARTLTREWANDYDVNRNTVAQFCDRHFAQDLKIDLLNARLPDGNLLANHAGFNRAILGMARMVDPRGTLLPNTSGAGVSSVESRIAEIEGKYMRAPHGSDSWKAYWSGDSGSRMQQEYRGLLAAREQAHGGRG